MPPERPSNSSMREDEAASRGVGNCPCVEGEARSAEARKILAKHPGRIPVICSEQEGVSGLSQVDAARLPAGKKKFLVPDGMTCGEFREIVRKHVEQTSVIGLSAGQDIRLIVEGVTPKPETVMSKLYCESKADNGFLYFTFVTVQEEQTQQDTMVHEDEDGEEETEKGEEQEGDARSAEARKILAKHPGRIPVICSELEGGSDLAQVDATRLRAGKKKFLVPDGMTCGELKEIVRKHVEQTSEIGLSAGQDIRLIVEGVTPERETVMSKLYCESKADDGFLYFNFVTVQEEQTQQDTMVHEDEDREEGTEEEGEEQKGEEMSVTSAAETLGDAGSMQLATAEEAKTPCEASPLVKSRAGVVGDLEAASNEEVPQRSEQEDQPPLGAVEGEDDSGKCNRGMDESREGSEKEGLTVGEVAVNDAPAMEDDLRIPHLAVPQCAPTASEGSGAGSGAAAAPPFLGPPLEDLRRQPSAERSPEASAMMAKFPDRVPVICEKVPRSDVPDLTKNKFLVPGTMNCGEFKYIVHQHVARTSRVAADQTIYLFVRNYSPKTGALMSELYNQYRAEDGFLHIAYSAECTLGGGQALTTSAAEARAGPTPPPCAGRARRRR